MEENHKPPHYEDDVKLASHRVSTSILNNAQADNLIIWGFPHKYKGFKIIVQNDKGYLLMAHELHPKGSFKADDGRTLEDHPHFHQVDYDRRSKGDNMPGTKHVVPSFLHPGISPAELLELFKDYYNFDDDSSDAILMPRIRQVQKALGDLP